MTKHRICPKCKSNKGFRLEYKIIGYGHIDFTFSGKQIDCNRETYDKTDSFVECLNCGKGIDIEKVKVKE